MTRATAGLGSTSWPTIDKAIAKQRAARRRRRPAPPAGADAPVPPAPPPVAPAGARSRSPGSGSCSPWRSAVGARCLAVPKALRAPALLLSSAPPRSPCWSACSARWRAGRHRRGRRAPALAARRCSGRACVGATRGPAARRLRQDEPDLDVRGRARADRAAPATRPAAAPAALRAAPTSRRAERSHRRVEPRIRHFTATSWPRPSRTSSAASGSRPRNGAYFENRNPADTDDLIGRFPDSDRARRRRGRALGQARLRALVAHAGAGARRRAAPGRRPAGRAEGGDRRRDDPRDGQGAGRDARRRAGGHRHRLLRGDRGAPALRPHRAERAARPSGR